MSDAKKDVLAWSTKQMDAFREEVIRLRQAIKMKTQQQVFSIARRTLSDLAGMGLEERMVDVFIRRLHELKESEKDLLVSALRATKSPVLVQTTFNLMPVQQASIEGAIKSLLGTAYQIQFQTAPDLVSGIELSANGQKIAWDIADYLSLLEKSVDVLLKGKAEDPKKETVAHE
jgi:F-type H+-transporting ATPase subunit b